MSKKITLFFYFFYINKYLGLIIIKLKTPVALMKYMLLVCHNFSFYWTNLSKRKMSHESKKKKNL